MERKRAVHAMTKTTRDQTAPTDDPLDQVDFILNAEQARALCELLANPPAANQALRELMARAAPWEADEPSV